MIAVTVSSSMRVKARVRSFGAEGIGRSFMDGDGLDFSPKHPVSRTIASATEVSTSPSSPTRVTDWLPCRVGLVKKGSNRRCESWLPDQLVQALDDALQFRRMTRRDPSREALGGDRSDLRNLDPRALGQPGSREFHGERITRLGFNARECDRDDRSGTVIERLSTDDEYRPPSACSWPTVGSKSAQ